MYADKSMNDLRRACETKFVLAPTKVRILELAELVAKEAYERGREDQKLVNVRPRDWTITSILSQKSVSMGQIKSIAHQLPSATAFHEVLRNRHAVELTVEEAQRLWESCTHHNEG